MNVDLFYRKLQYLLKEGRRDEAFNLYEQRFDTFGILNPVAGFKPFVKNSSKNVLYVKHEGSVNEVLWFYKYLSYLRYDFTKIYFHVPDEVYYLVESEVMASNIMVVDDLLWELVDKTTITSAIPMMSMALMFLKEGELNFYPKPRAYGKPGDKDKIVVGVCWNGCVNPADNMPLYLLTRLLLNIDVELVCLTPDVSGDVLRRHKMTMPDLNPTNPYYNNITMESLDLVVTVDSTVAQLAMNNKKSCVMLLGEKPHWLWEMPNFSQGRDTVAVVKCDSYRRWPQAVQKANDILYEKVRELKIKKNAPF